MQASGNDESVGSFTYQSLVGLTYLCGRGLGPEELARRFIVEIRPCIPATGVWLLHRQEVVAADVESGAGRPAMPASISAVAAHCCRPSPRRASTPS